MASIRRLAPVALAATVVLADCGGGGNEAARTSTSTTSTTASATASTSSATSTTRGDERAHLTQSCTHEDRGVRVTIRYPEGWHVNEQGAQPCSAFDPDPFQLPTRSEFPLTLAVVLRVEPLELDAAATLAGLRVEAERSLTVDGRRAVRQEVVTTGDGLAPAGLTSTRYVVDGGPERTIIASTFEVEGNDFERSVQVLDVIVAALEVEPRNP